jgi:two-component system, chemotaxis family, sensor kinase Cph1
MTGGLELSVELDRTFEQLFEASVHPAFVIEPFANRILAVNDAGCAMLGYTREELLELPVSRVHPAELPQFRVFLRRVLGNGHGTAMNLTCRTKDGRFLPTEMSLVALVSGGRAYILGLVRDRSEHRQRDPCG